MPLTKATRSWILAPDAAVDSDDVRARHRGRGRCQAREAGFTSRAATCLGGTVTAEQTGWTVKTSRYALRSP